MSKKDLHEQKNSLNLSQNKTKIVCLGFGISIGKSVSKMLQEHVHYEVNQIKTMTKDPRFWVEKKNKELKNKRGF